jgi:hypothetical protein
MAPPPSSSASSDYRSSSCFGSLRRRPHHRSNPRPRPPRLLQGERPLSRLARSSPQASPPPSQLPGRAGLLPLRPTKCRRVRLPGPKVQGVHRPGQRALTWRRSHQPERPIRHVRHRSRRLAQRPPRRLAKRPPRHLGQRRPRLQGPRPLERRRLPPNAGRPSSRSRPPSKPRLPPGFQPSIISIWRCITSGPETSTTRCLTTARSSRRTARARRCTTTSACCTSSADSSTRR